jgi:hypothetical protein
MRSFAEEEDTLESISDESINEAFYHESDLTHVGETQPQSEDLTIAATNKGKPKLCYAGYFYTIDRKNENNNKCFWKCERTGK